LFPDIFNDNGVTDKDYVEFEEYIRKNKIPQSIIDTFLEYGFNEFSRDNHFYILKWKTEPFIRYM